MATCPDGHASYAEDYCDVCGVADGGPRRRPQQHRQNCPACQAPISGRFCEAAAMIRRCPRPTRPGRTTVAHRPSPTGGPPSSPPTANSTNACWPRRTRLRRIPGLLPRTPHRAAAQNQKPDRTAQSRPGRRTRDRPRHPPGRPRRVHSARRLAHPGLGAHRHRPRFDERHQPQRQHDYLPNGDEIPLRRRRPHPCRRVDHHHHATGLIAHADNAIAIVPRATCRPRPGTVRRTRTVRGQSRNPCGAGPRRHQSGSGARHHRRVRRPAVRRHRDAVVRRRRRLRSACRGCPPPPPRTIAVI